MLKRLSIMAMVIGLVVSVLTACGGSNQNENGSNVPSTNEKEPAAVTLKVWDWQGGAEMETRKRIFQKYMDKNPHIHIDYSPLGINFEKAILLALKSGDDMPDIFTLPTSVPLSQGISEGWVQSLQPYVSPGFKERFYEGALVEGMHLMNGEVYTAPYGKMFSILLYYNKDLFVKAGLDPETPPITYSDVREAAKKITAAGKGEFYGFIEAGKQTGRFDYGINFLAMGGGGINYKEGIIPDLQQAHYSSDAYVEAVNFFKNMHDDGSMHPSTLSLTGMEARQLFGEGQAGMMIQAPVTIGPWKINNPDFNLGIAHLPVPDSGRKGYLYANYDKGELFLSSQSKHPQEATDLIEYIFSEEGMSELFERDGRMSALKSMNDPGFYMFEETMEAAKVDGEQMRIAPNITTRNPDISKVIANYNQAVPNLGQIVQGVLAGSLPDYKTAAEELDRRAKEQLEAAIKKAQAEGANVDMNDFKFPNWDPNQDYLLEDYNALK